MTRDEALRIAHERYGPNGSAWIAGGKHVITDHYVQWTRIGYGDTWEEALANVKRPSQKEASHA